MIYVYTRHLHPVQHCCTFSYAPLPNATADMPRVYVTDEYCEYQKPSNQKASAGIKGHRKASAAFINGTVIFVDEKT